jgi:hypothetical protein
MDHRHILWLAALAGMLALLASGCFGDNLAGRLCNAHGDCEEGWVCVQGGCAPACTTNESCPRGQACGDDGICGIPQEGRCDGDFDCERGTFCDQGVCRDVPVAVAPLCRECDGTAGACGPETNFCLRDPYTFERFCGLDCSSNPCPLGYRCVEIKSGGTVYGHQCVPRNGSPCPDPYDAPPQQQCAVDGDCQPGYACDGGACVLEDEDECTYDYQCGDGYRCYNGECEAYVAPGCTVDGDCDLNYRCQDSECVYYEAPECYDDYDCNPGYSCNDGSCVIDDTCTQDNQCGVGYICEDGSCISCANDTYYDNWNGFPQTFMQSYCVGCHAGYADHASVAAGADGILSSTVYVPYTMPPANAAQPEVNDRNRLGQWLRCGARY